VSIPLQHLHVGVERLTHWLGYAGDGGRAGATRAGRWAFFARRAWPLLLASAAGLAAICPLTLVHGPTGDDWLSLALLIASLVTLPHALLVSLAMDAPRWPGPVARQ
jgi:hypothetical protein